jgi:pyridoxamine 5'-phosphate oxidase
MVIEFWYARGHRLHERTVYESDVAGVWSKRMLYP